MMTSGRRETSMLGSCDHRRYAENPRRVMLFFMPRLIPSVGHPGQALLRGEGSRTLGQAFGVGVEFRSSIGTGCRTGVGSTGVASTAAASFGAASFCAASV